MDSTDLRVLRQLQQWLGDGERVWLVTVTATYGSSPRQPGAMLVIRSDGVLVGSVSGGCIEEDLVELATAGGLPESHAEIKIYGESVEDQQRFKLPCGGTLQLLVEPVHDGAWVAQVLAHIEAQQLIERELHLPTLQVRCRVASGDGATLAVDGDTVALRYGPRWRLLIIGAGDTSAYLADMAGALDYSVFVCEPREEMRQAWNSDSAELLAMMPDDAVGYLQPDPHTAIVALTHDPKLDDMALLEALKSAAFYVGALGSRRNNARRRQRLGLFDLSAEEIARMHGPVGLPIGSRTPAEIAVSILAELIAVRRVRTANVVAGSDKVSACLA